MNLTLKKALSIHPLNNATILAGRNGLDRTIDLIGILDAPDSARFVKPNEFVMTTGYIFKENPNCQKQIIEELTNRGAAGLGIKINRYISNILPEMINFANEHSFPLIALPNEYSWFEISSPILVEKFNTKKIVDTNFLDVLKDLSEKIVSSSNFDEMLLVLEEKIKTPCSIYNTLNNSIISYPSNFIQPYNIETIIAKSSDAANTLFNYNNLIRITNIDSCGYSIIVAPITYKTSNLGYILIWENQSRLTNEELAALQVAVMAIRLSFIESQNPKEDLMNAQNEFLFKLLIEDINNIDYIYFRANQLGIKLDDDYEVSVAEVWEKQESGSMEPVTGDVFNKFRNQMYKINRKFNVLNCFGKLGELIFLIPITPNINNDVEIKTIKAKVKEIKTDLERSYMNLVFTFGSGKYYPGLHDLKLSYKEAITSLKLGIKIYDRGTMTHFRDLGVYRFLSNPNIDSELKCFKNDFISPIIKFDNENNSELLKTLKIFLECGRSNRECAKLMFVHHNTIRYRLEQIEEICNLDIKSPETLLILEITMKILLLDCMKKS